MTDNSPGLSVGTAFVDLGGKRLKIEALDNEMRADFCAWAMTEALRDLERRRKYLSVEEYSIMEDDLRAKIYGGLFDWSLDYCSTACLQRRRTFAGIVELTRLRMLRHNTPSPTTEEVTNWILNDTTAGRISFGINTAEGTPPPNLETPEQKTPGRSENPSSDQLVSPGKESTPS